MKKRLKQDSGGFTIVEIVIACVIVPIIFIGIANAFDTVNLMYAKARQLNEMYTVLSACPELDRALIYDDVNSTTNCYPNNTFQAENGSSNVITYAPSLTITPTTSLANGDALQNVNDSKAVDIQVAIPNSNAQSLELRMLITRNGIGQQ